jgi:NAD(P)-dependent dehydrogenase (short-subunit alcohol dehydrogenase family)
MDRSDRTVLVTGANSGIGLATAIEVARQGLRAVGSVRSDAKGDVLRDAADQAGVEVEVVLLDVTDADQCADVLGGLDLWGLVNNAGYALTGAVEDVDEAEARALFDTMVFAPVRLARLALPAMRARGQGRIVNVSSIAGRVSAPFGGWYAGAKHAIEALSDALRVEVARDGVHVALVEPGGVKTNIWEDLRHDVAKLEAAGSRHTEALERFQRVQQLIEPIMGQPEQCARTIATALTTRLPRDRYLVGLDAQAINLTNRLTPTPVVDRFMRLVLGL